MPSVETIRSDTALLHGDVEAFRAMQAGFREPRVRGVKFDFGTSQENDFTHLPGADISSEVAPAPPTRVWRCQGRVGNPPIGDPVRR